jgi:hypothetical protein
MILLFIRLRVGTSDPNNTPRSVHRCKSSFRAELLKTFGENLLDSSPIRMSQVSFYQEFRLNMEQSPGKNSESS